MLPEAVKVFGGKIKEEELKGKGWALGMQERKSTGELIHQMWFKIEISKQVKGIVYVWVGTDQAKEV